MAGNANTTISWPGDDWQMLWSNGPFGNCTQLMVQLDIVGFLAVLGEGAVRANYQVSALSPLSYLPRIVPAPQALLPPTRATELASAPGKVTAVHSGNTKNHVHHVAHVLLGLELKTFEVRCVEVKKKDKATLDAIANRPMRRITRRMTSLLPTRQDTESRPLVDAAPRGPLSWVIVLCCFLSIGLLISSVVFGDGMSLVATILLSFLSTLTGIANKWKLKLPRRPANDAPPGDTVIRYPNGSYLIVRCEEEVARELYFAPEEIEYRISSQSTYRIISLIGTIILMLGIIALANAKLQLQFAWTGAYIITNAAHWVVAALPQRLHWDLSCYEIHEDGVEGGPDNSNFTGALWKAILLTKDTRWVKNGEAAPQTAVWDLWLVEAERQARLVGYEDKAQIQDPIFGDRATKGRVWQAPRGWDPKAAWNRISTEAAAPPEATFGAKTERPPVPAIRPAVQARLGYTREGSSEEKSRRPDCGSDGDEQ